MDDFTERAFADRASEAVQRASHGSVTEEILLGEGRFSNEFYLYDRPAVAHLDDGEQPHYAFFNDLKGIGVGSKRDTRTPDEGGATVMLVTDRRVMGLVGRRDGDERLTVPYDVVTGADYSTGLMKHRIAVETVDTTYHLWIDSGYDEAALQGAVDLIAEQGTGGQGPGAGSTAGASRAPLSSDGGATGSSAGAGSTGTGGGDGSGSPGDATGTAGGGAGEDVDDPLDRIERLKELNEKGVITDEEFERKKAELLDQI